MKWDGRLGTGLERRKLLDVFPSNSYRRHLMSCSGCWTLIIPELPFANFSPFLREGSSQFRSFVPEVFVLPAIRDLVTGRSISLALLFFVLARGSECWICVQILGELPSLCGIFFEPVWASFSASLLLRIYSLIWRVILALCYVSLALSMRIFRRIGLCFACSGTQFQDVIRIYQYMGKLIGVQPSIAFGMSSYGIDIAHLLVAVLMAMLAVHIPMFPRFVVSCCHLVSFAQVSAEFIEPIQTAQLMLTADVCVTNNATTCVQI